MGWIYIQKMLKLNMENIKEFQDGLQVSDVSSWGWQCHSPNTEIEEKDDLGGRR